MVLKMTTFTTSTVTAHLSTDDEIISAYRSGQQEQAITAFVRLHQRTAYSTALRYLNCPEDARDCAQDALIAAVKSFSTFKGESSLRSWLIRITRNKAIGLYRRRRWLRFLPFGDSDTDHTVMCSSESPFDQLHRNEFEVFFRTILAKIPPRQREVFMMRYFEDLTYDEISAQTGRNVGTLKANYHWAVNTITNLLRTSEYFKEWRSEFNDEL